MMPSYKLGYYYIFKNIYCTIEQTTWYTYAVLEAQARSEHTAKGSTTPQPYIYLQIDLEFLCRLISQHHVG